MLWYTSILHFVLFYFMDIPHFILPIHILTDIWIVLTFWLLWIVLLWTFMYNFCIDLTFSYLLIILNNICTIFPSNKILSTSSSYISRRFFLLIFQYLLWFCEYCIVSHTRDIQISEQYISISVTLQKNLCIPISFRHWDISKIGILINIY